MLRINCFRMDFIHSNVEDVRIHLEQQDNRSQSVSSTAANALTEEHTLGAAVTPLFKLMMGVTASSEGIACARVAGKNILNYNLAVISSLRKFRVFCRRLLYFLPSSFILRGRRRHS